MLLIPYKFESTFTRIPYVNIFFIAVTSIIFFLPEELFPLAEQEAFVLRGWDASGLLGNMFLHGDIFHLLGNMLFLWIFGNAICATTGNASYAFLYIFLGVFASVVHLSADGHAAIGASGAINGVVGMTLVLFPLNKIRVWYYIWWRGGRAELRAFWMILYWLAFDIMGSIGSPDGIAHWAHLGGLSGGILIASCALKLNLIETYHLTLFDVFAGRREEDELTRSRNLEQQIATAVPNGYTEPLLGEPIPGEILGETPPPVSSSPVPSPPIPMTPDIQLKRCVGQGTLVTLYIVNNGAAMNTLRIKVPQGVTAQMSQIKSFRHRESGWIRFSTTDTAIDSIEFIIAYQDAAKAEHRMRFRCIPAASTLDLVSTTP